MLSLSLASKLEKNKVSSTGVWLVLIEVRIPSASGELVIRAAHNTEDIIWNNETYVAFPFEFGEINEDGEELPSLDLKLSNVTGIISRYFEETNGATGATVYLRVVHSEHLDDPVPAVEEIFTVQTVNVDVNYATFRLGGETATTLRRPVGIYQKNHCPFKFKDIRCGYNGPETDCNKTLACCRSMSKEIAPGRPQSERFGGCYGLPGGFYAK
jgi:lambda family phage minor tail protein L